MTKVVTWNGVSSASIPELVIGPVTRSLYGKLRGEYLEIPGAPGGRFFAEKPGLRKISMECFVEGDSFPTDRRDAVTAVADWLDQVEGEAQLTISDEPDVYYLATLSEPPDTDEWREFGVFTIEFIIQPYAFDEDETIESWEAAAASGHTWSSGVLMVQYPRITVSPNGGYITALSLTMNGQTFTWAGSLAADFALYIYNLEGLVYNTEEDDEFLTGAVDSNYDMTGVGGDFLYLIPGSNTLSVDFDGTATSVDVSVIYRIQYRK